MLNIPVKYCFLIYILLTISALAQAQCTKGDCKNGKGSFVYPSGARYTGEFRNGEINGFGICTYSDGSKYEGNWYNRYPDGKGTKTYSDGSKRSGTWKKGAFVEGSEDMAKNSKESARGEQEGDGMTIQYGCINGDCENGGGTYAYPDGSKYEGQFKAGKIHGWGTFFYTNGDKYIGGFKENVAHGKGTIFKSNGDKTTGEWKDGEYIGAAIVARDRVGCIEGNCGTGYGTYIYKDGAAKYIGKFMNNLPNGSGTVYYTNGERYVGEFLDGAFEGKGALYLKDGTIVDGQWNDGTYAGASEVSQQKVENVGNKAATKVADKDEPTTEIVDNKPVKDIKKDESTTVISTTKIPAIKVWAVVIGVSAYNHMPVLRYTDDDAYRMYAFLKSPEGGAIDDEHIKILIDEEATKDKIVSTMQDVFGRAGKNDLIMLYFSGHGLKGAFLPIDFDGFNNKLLHEEVSEILKQSPAKYKLCIADACHSGSLVASKGGSAEGALTNYYKSLAQAQAGTALIMSSKSEETSLESNGLRQGVFSHFLIRGLKGEADVDGNKIVTVQELFNFINVNVIAYTGHRQSPVIQGDYDPEMTVAVTR